MPMKRFDVSYPLFHTSVSYPCFIPLFHTLFHTPVSYPCFIPLFHTCFIPLLHARPPTHPPSSPLHTPSGLLPCTRPCPRPHPTPLRSPTPSSRAGGWMLSHAGGFPAPPWGVSPPSRTPPGSGDGASGTVSRRRPAPPSQDWWAGQGGVVVAGAGKHPFHFDFS